MTGEVHTCGVCGEVFEGQGMLHGVQAGLWLLLGHRLVCPVPGGFDCAVGAAHSEDGGDLGPGGSVGFGFADDAGAFEVEGVCAGGDCVVGGGDVVEGGHAVECNRGLHSDGRHATISYMSTDRSDIIAAEIAAEIAASAETPAQAGALTAIAGVIFLLSQDAELIDMAAENDQEHFAEGCKSPAFQQKLARALLAVRAATEAA